LCSNESQPTADHDIIYLRGTIGAALEYDDGHSFQALSTLSVMCYLGKRQEKTDECKRRVNLAMA
jgi:hypothetical protein